MKKILMLSMLFVCTYFVCNAEQNILLPEVEAKIGMDVLEAIEKRAASRHYSGEEVPLKAISTILWAGYGIVLVEGDKTVHGYDAVSAATSKNRYTIPFGWESPYLRIYLLLEDAAYEYLPENHILKFITNKNLIPISGSSVSGAYGVIVIAADFDAMPSGFKGMTRDVALFSAGSAAQNMYVAGTVYKIQMLTQLSMKNNEIKKGLDLTGDIETLMILSFGYSK